jgi:hypothetical protein
VCNILLWNGIGEIDCSVEWNGCNRLLWNGIGLLECVVELNGCNRLWCETECVK